MLCNFSSTVARISSSLAALFCCSWVSWASSVVRISASRRALPSLMSCNCRVSVSPSVPRNCTSCCAKASICAFCVRVASAACCDMPS
ncbi:hypothetical protein Y695_04682 [Hydrogenophaga sp. T4]|nr:hypothetical protein Y695_04682 [Hydrogenophaga sp. T4]